MKTGFDMCDRCGKTAKTIWTFDGEICETCLNTYYRECGICGEYFDISYEDDEPVKTKGGKPICRSCAEKLENGEMY